MTSGEIAALFDPPVVAAVATPDLEPFPLTPDEAACMVHAAPARRTEFALGRTVMRQALRDLGREADSLPSRADRAPRWPPGVVGSLTHCQGFCAAVAARADAVASLGLDAEPVAPLEPRVIDVVCREQDRPHAWPRSLRAHLPWPLLVFSAKEAAYKCQHPLTGVFLDFPDLFIDWAPLDVEDGGRFRVGFPKGAPGALGGRRIEGGWRLKQGLAVTGAWIGP